MIEVNEYFGGDVKSLAYKTTAGKSTIGVIEAGEYEFGTGLSEIMTIIEGELTALLPESNEWKTYTNGQAFNVSANSSFKVKASAQVAYLCQYR